jgi:hypothetical protein
MVGTYLWLYKIFVSPDSVREAHGDRSLEFVA